MAKKSKKKEDVTKKVVAKCDNPNEVVANCNNPDEVIANCENPQENSLSQYDIEKLIVTVRVHSGTDFYLCMLESEQV